MKNVKQIKNHNYAFVLYDIKDNPENRGQKVFKVCKKYFKHHQKSIFRGNITPSKLLSLKQELLKIIDKNEDFVTILKLRNEESFDEELLGINKKRSEDIFI